MGEWEHRNLRYLLLEGFGECVVAPAEELVAVMSERSSADLEYGRGAGGNG